MTTTATTIEHHASLLPTAPGRAAGIVAYVPGEICTVQCSVCYRTLTGRRPVDVVVLAGWKFSPDDGASGATKYRRCPDCCAAGKHPAVQA